MTGDDHIKQLLKQGLEKFDLKSDFENEADPRTQAPDQVPSLEELGYEYETNPLLKKRVEQQITELKRKQKS